MCYRRRKPDVLRNSSSADMEFEQDKLEPEGTLITEEGKQSGRVSSVHICMNKLFNTYTCTTLDVQASMTHV